MWLPGGASTGRADSLNDATAYTECEKMS
jgi:hypothetical protein